MELKDNNLYEADVIIAAGLPLTWTGTQKAQFAAYLKQNKSVAEEYVREIFRRLREHGYDADTMKLYVTGGGGCLIEHFYRG